jgi:predicted nucleic acid-binding protein
VNFLLDTNVVSEWVKPRPDKGVMSWLAEADEDRVFISVVTLAELRHGIERLSPGARRDRLDVWLTQQLPERFETRILSIDAVTANSWGRVMARGQAAGRPIGTMDAFIAATAERHDLTLITRNVSDFEALGTKIVNPWSSD